MPRPVNSFVQIAKRLAALQIKSSKINEEISALVAIVAVELKKQDDVLAAAPAAPAKAAPAKATPAKAPAEAAKKPGNAKAGIAAPAGAAKKRGRPSKK